MMNILIIFTGGTIGSSVNNGTISPDGKTKYQLIDNYQNEIEHIDNITFQCIEPYTVLSENLSADNINSLIRSIKNNYSSDIGGIIITHGTDTIQFTASALGYAFSDIDIPVIIVSSNYPLSEKGSNGDINFKAAVEFITNNIAHGVFVAYANFADEVKFHRANSLLSHQETDDDLLSINKNEFAVYKQDKIVLNEEYVQFPYKRYSCDFELVSNSRILVVSCYPGSGYEYSLNGYKAIIFRPYHSGTLNTSNSNFINLCKKAIKANIPTFIVNVKSGNAYESSAAYKQLNINVLPYSTFASIYVKIWIAISNNLDIQEFVQMPLAGEFVE